MNQITSEEDFRKRAAVLHERATKAAKMNKWSEKELVVVFHELDTFGGYRFYGAKSLYDYAMKTHKLSDSIALNIINVARKSKEVPAIREAVVNGTISISAARKMVPVITKESAEAWIEFAATSSVRDVERAVAEAKPELLVQESAKYVAKDRLKVVNSFDEEAHDKLRRVMDIESQRKNRAVGQSDAQVAALDAYLEKHDPLLKAERIRDRQLAKQNNAAAPVTGQVYPKLDEPDRSLQSTIDVPSQKPRTPYPAALTHAIDLRDGCRCTHIDEDGERCKEQRWLHYHHLLERAKGGQDTLENMVTLCSGHHRLRHWLSEAAYPQATLVRSPATVYH